VASVAELSTIARCSESILQELNDIPSDYPSGGVELLDLGKTDGLQLPIKAVRIGSASSTGGDPQLVFYAGQHGREWVTTQTAMELFRYFADSYQENDNGVASLLKGKALVIVPVTNPDGYEASFLDDRRWRTNAVKCGDGNIGIDPNRNGGFAWGEPGSDDVCTSFESTYRGPSTESEAETAALEKVLANDGLPGSWVTRLSVNVHSYANTLMFPDGFSPKFAPGTTNTNCSSPDVGAFHKLVGTDVATQIFTAAKGDPPDGQVPDGEGGEKNVSGLAEYPTVRVSVKKNLDDPDVGLSGPSLQQDDVIDGVGYRLWLWRPDPANDAYTFPREIPLCAKKGTICEDMIIAGGATIDLCSGSRFNPDTGWGFKPDAPGGPQNECYWDFAAAGQGVGEWILESNKWGLSEMTEARLVYSVRKVGGVHAEVVVSENGFSNCSRQGFGACRIVRTYPRNEGRDSLQRLSSGYRTQVVDISDFDGLSNVQVRFRVTESPGSGDELDIYDPVIVGWKK
jgi:hypothetical protein